MKLWEVHITVWDRVDAPDAETACAIAAATARRLFRADLLTSDPVVRTEAVGVVCEDEQEGGEG